MLTIIKMIEDKIVATRLIGSLFQIEVIKTYKTAKSINKCKEKFDMAMILHPCKFEIQQQYFLTFLFIVKRILDVLVHIFS